MSEKELTLEEYAEIEGDEHGEACRLLLSIKRYYYCFDDVFIEAVEKELTAQLMNFRENSEVVEEDVIRKPMKVVSLKWRD